MLFTVARFELGQRLKRLSTWIYFTLFLALGLLFFLAPPARSRTSPAASGPAAR